MDVRNKFKGLDLINRVPDKLWMEVYDIVQETGIKTIPMEKKCKKAKWLSGEALQIVVKRREAKCKGHLFWVLVLKGLGGLHRNIQLQLLQRYWSGHRLELP